MATVREETYRLIRALGLTTVFGNPGSTEEPFFQDFPADFTYVLGLQEAGVVAMADGYAQATGSPALVSLHTAPGVGNGMGALVGAWHNKTPLVVTAGQQTREMLLLEPWLMNVNAAELPRPSVKWSYETARAEDGPGALMRAYAAALLPPSGPVFLSLPMDDWAKTAGGETPVRQVSRRAVVRPKPCPGLRRGHGPQRRLGRCRPAGREAARAGLLIARFGARRLPRGPSAVHGGAALCHWPDGREAKRP